MEREILFRGKTTVKEGRREFNNMWVMGDLITSRGKFYIHPKANAVNVEGELGKIVVMHEVIPETVGQFTGLLDRDGRMIFEGDIVVIPFRPISSNGDDIHATGFVKWIDGEFIIVATFEDEDGLQEISMRDIPSEYIEIIGNIHDNPELLLAK